MTALITGASSGLGAEFARQLSAQGYDIIAVARRHDRLLKLEKELPTGVTPIVCDLGSEEECFSLFDKIKDKDIDIFINNAGFGLLGEFSDSELQRELEMIDVNCKAPHILTKLILEKFLKADKGYILNVCSVGGYMPGPLLSSYYATKAYTMSLTKAVAEEVRRSGKNVYIGCTCPGPIDTEFNSVAKGRRAIKARSAAYVAKRSLSGMFRRRITIIPGGEVKLSVLASKLLPENLMLRITYDLQKKKL